MMIVNFYRLQEFMLLLLLLERRRRVAAASCAVSCSVSDPSKCMRLHTKCFYAKWKTFHSTQLPAIKIQLK